MARTILMTLVLLLVPLERARAQAPVADERSPTIAALIGVSGPVLGIAIAGVGASDLVDREDTALGCLVVGATLFAATPTLAHTYAGRTWSLPLGVKLVSLGVIGAGALTTIGTTNNGITVPALVGVGAIGVLGATIVEIATAPGIAREHNQRGREVVLAPLVTGDGGGLVLGGRF